MCPTQQYHAAQGVRAVHSHRTWPLRLRLSRRLSTIPPPAMGLLQWPDICVLSRAGDRLNAMKSGSSQLQTEAAAHAHQAWSWEIPGCQKRSSLPEVLRRPYPFRYLQGAVEGAQPLPSLSRLGGKTCSVNVFRRVPPSQPWDVAHLTLSLDPCPCASISAHGSAW